MNPIIATSIAAQRQQDLLASAAHYRRLRRHTRSPRAGRAGSIRAGTVRRRLRLQAWLAAVRL